MEAEKALKPMPVPRKLAAENARSVFWSTYQRSLLASLAIILPLMIIGYFVGPTASDDGNIFLWIGYALIAPFAAIWGFYRIHKNLLYRPIARTSSGLDWGMRYQGEFAYADRPRGVIYRAAVPLIFCIGLITLTTGSLMDITNLGSVLFLTTLYTIVFLFITLRFFRAMLLYPPTETDRREYRAKQLHNNFDETPLSAGDIRNTTSPISLGSPQYQDYLAAEYQKQINQMHKSY